MIKLLLEEGFLSGKTFVNEEETGAGEGSVLEDSYRRWLLKTKCIALVAQVYMAIALCYFY